MKTCFLLGINLIFLFILTMPFDVISYVSYLTLILKALTNLLLYIKVNLTYCELSMTLKPTIFQVITQRK